MIDYLWDQMHEKPSPTFPRTLMGAPAWMEVRAGVANGDKLHLRDIVKRSVEKAAAEAEQGAPERVRAPRLPVVVLAGLECSVLRDGLPLCLRVVAWARLLKVYGSLRSDNLQRIRPQEVRLQEGGLSARLQRTKTSGAGKKVKDLALFVPECAWILKKEWLAEGFKLWRDAAPWDRDYFLPRTAADLESFVHRAAEPADIAALNTRILEELLVPHPEGHDEEGGAGGELLLGRELVHSWSGHSERATLASGLASLGVPRAERDPIGRWCAEGSDAYVRSYRAMVRKLVALYTSKVRDSAGFIDLDEEDAVLDARRLFVRKGLDTDKAEKELMDLIGVAKGFFRAMEDKGDIVSKFPTVAGSIEPIFEKVGDVCDGDAEESEDEYEFIIAMARRNTQATLHRKNGCWRAQKLSFSAYELVQGPELPTAKFYTGKCRDCWREEQVKMSEVDVDDGAAAAGSSSSSSSSAS